MEDYVKFLASVTKVLAKTKSVLEFYKSCPEYPASDLNFEPYLGALLAVCREQSKGAGGVDDLRNVLSAFELFRTHKREGGTSELIASAVKSLVRYDAWLDITFSEIRQHGSNLN